MNKGRRWVTVVLAVVLALVVSIAAAQAAVGTESGTGATVDGNSARAALKQTPAAAPGNAGAPAVPLSCTKQLVVLLDASDSISTAEWNTQLDGLSAAILDPDCVRRDGSIQLTVIKYYTVNAGSIYQTRTPVQAGLDHVFITDGNAVAVANAIQSISKPPSPPWIKNWTPLASAIDAATAQLTGEHIVDGAERIINISHDGNTNINRTGNAYVGEILARPDAEAARADAIAAGIDEITAEGLGDIDDPGEDDLAWLRDNIAYPQPGHDAPASWEPGWVYHVDLDAGKFKEAICHKVDNEPPVITCPADVTVECDEPTDPWYTGNATAIDDCDPDPIITWSDVETPGECEQETIITRTWTATDSIGNSATCVQTITVVDTTPPEITVPGNVTIECDESTDPWYTGNATAIDNCDPEPVVTYSDVETPGECEQETIITRTWRATDDCGNFAEGNQTITVVDTTPPEITVPGNVTIECDVSKDPWYTGNATAIDNCDDDPDITWSHVENPGQCEGETIITRTWRATDDCGNFAEGNQTITVVDTTPPEITVPADVEIECDESTDPYNTGNGTAIDNCDPNPEITWSDVETPGQCGNLTIITRTWRATDDCGNFAEGNQTITFVDITPPEITVPADVEIECDESTDPWYTGNATAIDNCDPEPAITWSDVEAPGRCANETIITRTWRATDDCGNFAEGNQTITIVDTTPPVITVPPDAEKGCDEDKDTGNATAIDNCDPDPEITYSDSSSNGVITRTWRATDDCGNFAEGNQTITIGNDTTPPVIDCPDDVIIECDESTDPSNTGNATATDFCDDDLEINYDDVENPGQCGNETIITRTWWAEDDSGNRANCTQTITVEDTTPPEITIPADVEIDCDESKDPSNTGNATATDNCDDDPTITYSDSSSGTCPGIITRTWTATDDCGNFAEGNQTITKGNDTTPPVITCPPPVTIGFGESTDPSNTGNATATDDCDIDPAITWDDIAYAVETPPDLTQVVVLLDGSDSMSSAEWDTQIDGLSNAIQDPDCVPRDDSVQLTVMTYYTRQNDSTYSTFVSVAPGLDHVFITGINAGDVASAIQNIVKPPSPPWAKNWTPLAAAIDAATAQLAGDNAIEDARRIINIGHDGNTNINRTGNAYVGETIARADAEAVRTAAIAAGIDEISVEGIGDIDDPGEDDAEWLRDSIVYPQPGTIAPPFTSGWVYLVGTDAGKFKEAICAKLAADGAGQQEFCERLIERTWTATDDCGNSASCTQIITIQITAPPVITCPPDTTVECDESTDPSNTGYATATDVSDPNPVITYTDSISNGVITRTWTATNECGISAECTQTITIVGDTTPPEITVPADVAIECDESADPSNTGNATATDNCDSDPTVSYSDDLSGSCPGIITRTWTATDDSGNTANGTQIITVGDTTPPEIICPVDVLLGPGESTDPSNTGNATATDNCDPDPSITYTDEVTLTEAPPATTQLVVLLDASDSINSAEWSTQINGLSNAISDPDCVPHDGSAQLTVIKYYTVQYGSTYQTRTLVEAGLDHVFITDGNAGTVASTIQSIGKPPSPPWIRIWTPLASAIDAATAQLTGDNAIEDATRIINISHDGNANINRTGNAYVGETMARVDAEAARAAAIAAGIDEISVEGLGDIDDVGEDDPEWLRDSIVYPQPGTIAPPFTSGWVYLVGTDAGKFEDAICNKFPSAGQREIIIRTWTATDDCGNTASCNQEIVLPLLP